MVASLQSKLLPQEDLIFSGLSLQTLYRTSGHASGDYYDFFPLDEDTLRIVIADVSGHGARAAFLMAVVRTLFRTTQANYLDLTSTMELVNRHLFEIVGDESDFVSLFSADISVPERQITYVNAGHCPGLLRLSQDRIIRLDPLNTVLGFFTQKFAKEKVDISEDSGLLVFTDGFYEWETETGELLGLERFIQISESLIIVSPFYLEQLLESLMNTSSMRPVFRDDISALWVQMESK